MMTHRNLLPLQRQNKRTDMKEKSINRRHLIKHCFCRIRYKGFHSFFPPHMTQQTEKELLSHMVKPEEWQQSSDLLSGWTCTNKTGKMGGQLKVIP